MAALSTALLGAPLASPLAAQVAGVTGTLIITNKAPATATLVDIASGTIVATLPTGNGPHEVVTTRDGKWAVVSDYGTGPAPGSTLTLIDVAGAKVARKIDVAPYMRPHGLAMLPGDTLVAVTSEATKNVLLVDLRSGTIVKVIATGQTGSHMVGVTADGRRGWTGDIGSNTVTELDLVAGTMLRHIDVPAQPEAVNVTPDGSEVWVGSNALAKVSAVDTRTGAVSTAAEGFGWPYRVLFMPDAKQVILPDYRGESVRFLDRASRQELGRLAFPGAGPQGITLSRDARHAFLSLSAQAKVAVIEVAGRRVLGEVAAGETPDGVAYSAIVLRR